MDLKAMMSKLQASARPSTTPPATPSPPLMQQQQQPQQPQPQYPPQFAQPMQMQPQMQMQMPPGVPMGQPLNASTEGQNPPWPFGQAFPAFNQNQGGAGVGLPHPHAHPYAMGFPPQPQQQPQQQPGQIPQQQPQQQPHFMYPGFVPPPGVFPPAKPPGFAAGPAGYGPPGGPAPVQTNGVPLNNSHNNIPAPAPSPASAPAPSESHSHLLKMLRNSSSNQSSGSVVPQTSSAPSSSSSGSSTPSPPPAGSQTSTAAPLSFSTPAPAPSSSLMFSQQSSSTMPGSPSSTVDALTSKLALLQQKASLSLPGPSLSTTDPGSISTTSPVKSADLFSNYRKLGGPKTNSNAKNKEVIKKTLYTVEDEETEWPSVICENISRTKLDRAVPISVNRQYLCFAVQPSKLRVFLRNSQLTLLINFEKIITDLQFIESSNFLIVSLVDGELQMLRLKSDSQHTEIKHEIMGVVRLEKKTPFKRILLCGSSSKFGVLTDENIFVMSFNPHNLIGAQSNSNATSLITVDSNYAFETTVVDASFNESGNVFVSLANQRLISFSNPTEPNLLLESPTLIETVLCLPQKILLTASESNQSIQLYRYDDQVDNVQHLQELNFLPSPTRRLIVPQKQSNLLLVCNAYDSVLMILDLNAISSGEILLSRFHFAGKILSAVEVLDNDDIHLYVSNGEGLTMCKFSLKDCTLVPSSPSSSSSSSSPSSSSSSGSSSGSVATLPPTSFSKLSGSVDSSVPAQPSGIPLSLLSAFNAAKKESTLSASHDGSILGPITSISQLLSSTSATFSSSSLPVLPPVSASSISLASLESAFSAAPAPAPAPAPALKNEAEDQPKTVSENGSEKRHEEEQEEEEASDTESLSHQGQDASQDSSDESENVHATNDPSGHDDPNEYEAERLAFRKASGLASSSPLQQPLPTPLLDATPNANNANGGDDNDLDHQGSEETEASKKLKKSFDPTNAYNKSSFVDNDLFVATFQTPLSECIVEDHDTPFEPHALAQIEEIPLDTPSPSKRKNKRSKKKRSVSPTPSTFDDIQQQQHHHHHHHHAAEDHQQEKEEDEATFTKGFRVGFVPATLQFPEGYDPSFKAAKTNAKSSAKSKSKTTTNTNTNNTFSSASHSSNAAPEEPKRQPAAPFSLSDTVDDIPFYAQSPRFQSGTFGEELTKSIEYCYDNNSREASPTPPPEEKPKTPAKKNAKNKQQPSNATPAAPALAPQLPSPASGATTTTPKKKPKTPSTPAVPPVSPTPQPKTKKAKNKAQPDATTTTPAATNKPGPVAPVNTPALPLKTKAKATSGTGTGAPQKSPRPEAGLAWTPVATPATSTSSSSGFAVPSESSSSSSSLFSNELSAAEISAQQKIISQISQSVADRLYTRLDGERKKAAQKPSAPKDDLKAFLTESIANHTEPVMKAYFDQLIQSTLNSPETTSRIDRMVSMAFDRARGAVNATIQQRTARLNAMISSQIQNLYAPQEGPTSPASSSSSTTYPQSAPSSSTFSSSGGVYFGNGSQATSKPQSSSDPSTNAVLSFLSKHGTNGQAIPSSSSSSSSAQRSVPRTVQAPSSPLDCRSLELRLSTEPPVEAPKPSYSDALYDALSQRDLKSVVALCEQIWDPQWVFGGREDVDAPPAVLERMNGISLALLSQLSFDLHDKTDLKLRWIAGALKKVKLTSSPKTLEVLEKVKAGANNVIRSFHSASPQTRVLALSVLSDINTLTQPRH